VTCCVCYVRFCLTARGGFCYTEKDVIDLNTGILHYTLFNDILNFNNFWGGRKSSKGKGPRVVIMDLSAAYPPLKHGGETNLVSCVRKILTDILFLCRIWRGIGRFTGWGSRGCDFPNGIVTLFWWKDSSFLGMSAIRWWVWIVRTFWHHHFNWCMFLWILHVQDNNQYLMYTPFDPLMFVAHKVHPLPASLHFCVLHAF